MLIFIIYNRIQSRFWVCAVCFAT